MTYDRPITICTAGTRLAAHWPAQRLLLSELYARLQLPVRGTETYEAYMAMRKPQQDDLKDVGGYVLGELRDGRRKVGHVVSREVLTLDVDNLPAGATDDILRRVDSLGCGYCIYSTRKHSPGKPRLRILLPLDRPVTADEYEAIARKAAQYIDPSMTPFDRTTFEPSRLMYWPSRCADGEYVYITADKPMICADGMLAAYTDWHNYAEWPQVPGAQSHTRLAAKQGDPTGKQGVVGAFCRTYDVPAAMDTFLPGCYSAAGEGRYTYVEGSTTGGAVLYDDGKFLYSHHATDPCSGRLVNAFDLVRLHRFADLDDDVKPDTPTNRLPSYTEMTKLALGDAVVAERMNREQLERIAADFGSPEELNADWTKGLTCDQNGGFHKTINNISLLLQHAPELRGSARKDDFTGRIHAAEGLPWRTEPGYWSDADTTELRKHFETHYHGFKPAKQDIKDAVIAVAVKQRFHPVRDYLSALIWDGQPRLDTLFIDYLGVADTEYTRAVTRKALVGAVARVITPGCKFDYMPVFVGRQGRGKSSIIFILAGGEEWCTDSLVTFDGGKAFEAVTGKWLVEIPEMHAFDRVTMNQAKAFITKQSDFYRAAYAEFPEDRRRQCVFFGTTNNSACLRDETGGRRFWTMDIDAVERRKNIFTDLVTERDQVWAEAVVRWSVGEALFLPPEIEAMAAETQEAHREAHPWEDTIRNFVEQDIPADWDDWDLPRRLAFWGGGVAGSVELVKRTRVCVKEIWQEAFMMQIAAIDQQKARVIANVLNSLGGWKRAGAVRCGKFYGVQKCFVRDQNGPET